MLELLPLPRIFSAILYNSGKIILFIVPALLSLGSYCYCLDSLSYVVLTTRNKLIYWRMETLTVGTCVISC